MKMFSSILGGLNTLFGVDTHTKGALETCSLNKYRTDVGRPFAFTSAIPPVLPVAASNLWNPQVSIGEERKRPSHLLIDYVLACLETTPSRKREIERQKVEQAARKATEHARQAELAERAEWAEKARQVEVTRKMEAAKQAELARRATEEARARQAEEARRAEEARQAEEGRRVQEAMRAEEEARKVAQMDALWLRLVHVYINRSPRPNDSLWDDDGYGTDPYNEFNNDDDVYTADDYDDDGFFSFIDY